MLQRGWMVAAAVGVVLTAGAGWAWLQGRAGEQASGEQAAGGWSMIQPGVGASGQAATDNADQGTTLTAAQVRHKLFKEGSFAGTEPHGEWCARGEALVPCAGLRGRFEYYLLALGEVPMAGIRTLVADEAERDVGVKLAAEVMAMWDRYLQIRGYKPRTPFQQEQLHTWMPVLEDLRAQRRQVLGAEWAQAFYADEEGSFERLYAQIQSGMPPPPDPGEPVPQMAPGKDPAAVHAERVARYGPEAATRLAKVDQEWADWERRLSAARKEWERLQASAALSDIQRREQMAGYVAQHFKDEEHLRVQALLKL